MTDQILSPFEQALAKASRALNATKEEVSTLRRAAKSLRPDLPEFLLARIADDADRARTFLADNDASLMRAGLPFREMAMAAVARVLAECGAKRRIVEQAQRFIAMPDDAGTDLVLDDVLRALALPYADHPDCREEWKP